MMAQMRTEARTNAIVVDFMFTHSNEMNGLEQKNSCLVEQGAKTFDNLKKFYSATMRCIVCVAIIYYALVL